MMAKQSLARLAGLLMLGAVVVAPQAVAAATTDDTCQGATVTIHGTSGDDLIMGTNGRDVIAGGGDDDVIVPLGGLDVVCAGAGNDIVRGREPTGLRRRDYFVGGLGDDRLILGPGGGDLFGDRQLRVSWRKWVVGGDDVLIGGPRDERYFPGPGDDIIRGSGGYDQLELFTSTSPVVVDAGLGTVRGDGRDRFAAIEVIHGTDFDDLMIGSDGADGFNTGAGDDLVYGYGGDDDLNGLMGDDVVYGGPGADVIIGKRGDDYLDAGAGTGESISGGGNYDICRRADEYLSCEVQLPS